MDVRLPDGTVISNVPDNITKAELTERLSRNGYDVSKLGGQTAEPVTKTERVLKGMRDPVDGGAQLLTKVLPDSVVKAGNEFNNWLADKTGLVGRLPEGGVDQQVREAEQAYQARRIASTPTLITDLVTGKKADPGLDGYRMLGNVLSPANLALASKLPQLATVGGRAAVGAGFGGASAALSPVANGDFWDEKQKQVIAGAAFGGATPVVGNALARVVSPKASVNPNIALLKQEGVTPTVGQTLGGRWNVLEEKMQSLPIVGDAIANARTRALESFNKAALNRTVSPIGESVDQVGREGVSAAKSSLKSAYDSLLPKLKFTADDQFSADLSKVQGMVNSSLPRAKGHHSLPGEADIFDNIIQKQVVKKMTPAGTMSGETFKQVESELSRLARGYRGDQSFDKRQLGDALQEVVDSMRASLQRSNPSEAAQLAKINQGFANFARVRDAAGRVGADEGMFTPAQLQAAVRAADKSVGKGKFATGDALLQDLSEAGKSVLGNKVPNSFTTDRALIAGGALGSYLVNPAIPAGLLGGAALYSKPAQGLLGVLVSSRPEAAKPIADALNQYSAALLPLSTQVGLGLLK